MKTRLYYASSSLVTTATKQVLPHVNYEAGQKDRQTDRLRLVTWTANEISMGRRAPVQLRMLMMLMETKAFWASSTWSGDANTYTAYTASDTYNTGQQALNATH